ncbi:hypothetical protein [Nocardioides sp. B-3]|uniref:hypothetical protein n=1 Tax=Nocardioides sp. B-3 TaxID=2895565 RepID=UPI0021535924|nr:hypothetical protein [Nocardioides sp. B-3]UUZ59240.1 hypothetical protein LP418_25695 [Nocardioides sp. B-3]
MTSGLNRRNVLGGATAAAVGLPLLVACGGDEPDTASDPTTDPTIGSTSSDSAESPTDGAAAGAPGCHQRHPGRRLRGVLGAEVRRDATERGHLQGLHLGLHAPGAAP